MVHEGTKGPNGRKVDVNIGAAIHLSGRNLWVEKQGARVLEETANDFAPLRDVPGEKA